MKTYPIVHIEITAPDPKAAGEFYNQLFGWKMDYDAQMDYLQFDPGVAPGGGFPKADGQMFKPGDVMLYVGVDDIEGILQKAVTLGGEVAVPKTEIPGIGHFAILTGAGTKIALYTSMMQGQ